MEPETTGDPMPRVKIDTKYTPETSDSIDGDFDRRIPN